MKIEETNLRFRSSLVKGLQGLFQVATILRFPRFSYSVGFFFFLVGEFFHNGFFNRQLRWLGARVLGEKKGVL